MDVALEVVSDEGAAVPGTAQTPAKPKDVHLTGNHAVIAMVDEN